MEYDGLTDFIKAGRRHLADARELLEMPTYRPSAPDAGHRHLRAAIYLAGYAVECALKAYIISRTARCSSWREVLAYRSETGAAAPGLRGAESHNLRRLAAVAGLLSGLQADPPLRDQWMACRKWDVNWRYHPQHFAGRSDARDMVDAAVMIHDWVEDRRRYGDREDGKTP